MYIKLKNQKYNILFLSLLDFDSLEDRNIYTDLLSEFVDKGHKVFIISPIEKRNWKKRMTRSVCGYTVLKPKIGNIQKTNLFEKGISTIFLEMQFIKVIKKKLSKIKIDLIIYSTPPVTFDKCIKYVKQRDGAKSYLLLKDIFPQNALDLRILKSTGIKGFIYRYFRNKEIKLYQNSDFIGCMSKANVEYLLTNNTFIKKGKVEVNPNSEREHVNEFLNFDKAIILQKYNIPILKKILIYGGNIGLPQGVNYIKQCILENEKNGDAFILIIGSGTEYHKIENFILNYRVKNSKILPMMSKSDFEKLVICSDIGLVFLDSKFTIPNFPSRILTYMKYKKPLLVASDKSTDLGVIAKENGFGDYCLSDNADDFQQLVKKFLNEYDLNTMGKNAYDYFYKNFRSIYSYEIIMNRMKEIKNVY